MSLSTLQIIVVAIVYSSALVPLAGCLWLYKKQLLPKWLLMYYFGAVLISAIGWEIWFTFGLLDGQAVDLRRDAAMNTAIPAVLNCLLNSLADGAIAVIGIGIYWNATSHRANPFHGNPFPGLWGTLLWFVGQNILVELFLYQQRLSGDAVLSWAPLAPTGPYLNPQLIEVAGRSLHLQTQLPWLLMLPICYLLARGCYAKYYFGGPRHR